MRTLIYARYSSHLQNPRSVEDQIAACQAMAGREGWEVVGVYSDRAISGAAGTSADQRPGLNDLMRHVERGGIQQVLVDTSSRLARDLGDADRLRKLINYCGARLYSLADGEIDPFKGTIKALMDEHQRKEIAHNVRRGHTGNIQQGRAASGIAYGYRRVIMIDAKGEPIRGVREIDPDKAVIVLRIYKDYAAGISPLAIASNLNAEGVPPPRRGIWRRSTLLGHRATGFGILVNPVYIGRLVYGRTKVTIDPRTRERRMKPGDGNVQEGDAPHLRIISDELWQAVQDQIASRSTPNPEWQRRPKHMLSGMATCGVCGAGWVVKHKGWWGCSRVTGGNACTNRRMISTVNFERRVLAQLSEQMLASDVVSAYLREYHREHARLTSEGTRDRDRLERRRAEADRKVQRLVAAIADGGSDFVEIRHLLTAARDERDAVARELAAMEALPVLALHPGLADQYRRSVEELAEALADPATHHEAVPRMRKLIARIVVTPSEGKRGVELEVIRHLDQVLNFAQNLTDRMSSQPHSYRSLS
ncbi:recombinase family protein [Sphingomonas sp. Leaf4]|uniref:recombinase family protein n=1 Tax=Sphingomonas sp. Leaf4 TaxID=2876553 RepID=UPI001E43ED46|nr:recombinase family protein [Sphingomonas sp. Leaf4]